MDINITLETGGMTVNELFEHLKKIKNSGYGDLPVLTMDDGMPGRLVHIRTEIFRSDELSKEGIRMNTKVVFIA